MPSLLQKTILLSLFFSVLTKLSAQQITVQVFDYELHRPVEGATVTLSATKVETTDVNGQVNFDKVMAGRYLLDVQMTAFESQKTEFVFQKANPVLITVYLHQVSAALDTLWVSAHAMSSEPTNPLAYTSARSFTAEETDRIPAAINDPGRMVQSFAGVQGGRNDLENQIIVRGNSPFGIGWRVEGIDVPSPNHFTKHGSAGGGVSIFSTHLLDKSDFYTGGQPAEFGNALSGSFDIHFRHGNYAERNVKTKVGMLGIDLALEGPFKNKRSSYLVNYRYSTLGLYNMMKVFLVGERTINTFQDLSFNLAFNSEDFKKTTTIFGVGGNSLDHALPIPEADKRRPGVPDDWEDRYRPSNLGVIGITHQRNINERSSVKYAFALVGSQILRRSDTLDVNDVAFRYNTEDYIDNRISGSVKYITKPAEGLTWTSGVLASQIFFKFNKFNYPRRAIYDVTELAASKRIFANGEGQTQTIEPYTQLEKKFSNFSVYGGLHYMHLTLNNNVSLEPRLGAKYFLNDKNSLSFTAGRHSQLLPMATYFVTSQDANDAQKLTYPNKDVNFPISDQVVLGYDRLIGKGWHLATEVYYQKLRRTLVSGNPNNTGWMLNYADGYPDAAMTTDGKGTNKGIDVTLEHRNVKKYYVLLTASYFDATYTLADGRTFNSAFNDRYNTALTLGKEWTLKNERTLQAGARAFVNGGFRYSPLDAEASADAGFYLFKPNEINSLQAPAYFRVDGRVSYRFNGKKRSGILSMDIQNLTNNNNYSRVFYNNVSNQLILQRKGSGLTPIGSLVLDF